MMAGKNDNYETPRYLADWAVKYAKSQIYSHNEKSLSILEPGCGAKAPFANAGLIRGCSAVAVENREVIESEVTPFDELLQREGSYFSFYQKTDFLESDSWRGPATKFDIIATNPPFSKALPFIWKSLDLLQPNGVMIYLLRLSFLSSKQRMPLYAERPPAEVHILQRRPSFSYDGKTDMSEYAFFVWFGEEAMKYMRCVGHTNTALKWLDNGTLEKEWNSVP